MKKFLILAVVTIVATTTIGCSGQRGRLLPWRQGDACVPCETLIGQPAMDGMMMMPSSPDMMYTLPDAMTLPGPAEMISPMP